jgi:hypothetical protein
VNQGELEQAVENVLERRERAWQVKQDERIAEWRNRPRPTPPTTRVDRDELLLTMSAVLVLIGIVIARKAGAPA